MPSRKMATIFAHSCGQESLFLHISPALGVTSYTKGTLSSTLCNALLLEWHGALDVTSL